MKNKNKILLFVIAAAMAGIVHAGSYTWGFVSDSSLDPLGGGDEGYLNQGTAFLYLGTIAQTDNGDSTYSLDLSDATFVTSGGMNGDYTFGSPNTILNSAAITGTSGTDYTLVLVYDNNVSDLSQYEGYYYIETGSSTQGYNPQTEEKWAQFISTTAVDSWRTAAAEPVPEPTSGLLLLLGMAGLALKRKRA